MSEFLQLVLVVGILLTATKGCGLLSTRLGQPAVLGELLAGLLLGPSLLNLIHAPFLTSTHLDTSIHELAEFGVIFLMFIAGLEIEVAELRQAGKVATFAGVLGVVTPLLLGWGLAMLFGYGLEQSLFIGVLLTATSVSISAQTLMELNVLRSRVGVALLGAAVLDDVLVILVLSLFLAVVSGEGGWFTIFFTVARMVIFLSATLFIGRRVIPPLTRWVAHLPISQPVVTFAVITTLLLAWSAEVFGAVAAITGAFMAGLLFARTPQKAQIDRGLQGLAYGFLVPIFFASIGLQTDVRALSGGVLLFTILLCLVAVLGKVLGCGLGARMGGFSGRESIQVGIGMVSRGEVGLIVASVGISAGIITQDLFAITVVMVLVTTLVTPLLLRAAFRQPVLATTTPDHATTPPHE